MYHIWWISLNINVVLFVLAVAVSLAVIFVAKARLWGLWLLALSLHGVSLQKGNLLEQLVFWLSWGALALAAVAIVVFALNRESLRARENAWILDRLALGTILALVLEQYAAIQLWHYVLVPFWNDVLVPFWYWLTGLGWNWLWVLFALLVIAAIVLFVVLDRNLLGLIAAVAALAVVLVMAVHLVTSPNNNRQIAGPTRPESPMTAQPHNATQVTCPTWKMSTKTPKNGDWIHNGVPQIRTAKTRAQARHAANVWLDKVKRNSGTLSGAVSYFTNKTVTPSALVDKHGCATQRAVALSQETAIALAMSSVKPAMVPVTARNSGTRGGNVYAYNVAGIGGDLHAVQVTRNGKTIWILARCGNVASTGKPPVATGKPPKGAPMPPKHHAPVCVKPKYVPVSKWDYTTCHKKPSSFDYGQNTGPQAQPVQSNPTNVNTGPTSGTSGAPTNTKVHSGDTNPTKKGSNSGSTTGSGTPTGGGSDGSGGTTPTDPPADTGQGGTGNGDGGGTITQP